MFHVEHLRFCLPSGHCPRAAGLAAAARAAGHIVITCSRSATAERVDEFDILLSSGFASLKREQIARVIEAGKNAWVFDLGYFHRDYNRPGAYFQISINGLSRIPRMACPSDRWQLLDLPIAPDRGYQRDGHVLICAQKFGDNQHLMDRPEMEEWIKKTVAMIRSKTDRTIVLRPHPASMAWSVRDSNFYDQWQDAKKIPIEQAIGNVYAVVTHNSTVGYECIRQSVPVYCDRLAADYYALSSFSIENYITRPWTAHEKMRAQYLHRVAYGQWTQHEHEDGSALDFMLRYHAHYEKFIRNDDIARIDARLGVAA